MSEEPAQSGVRLDKWLWAARFYKTRQLAADAVRGGHVDINGARAKPARAVKTGDRLSIRKGPYSFAIEVLELVERRVSAKQAQALYRESEDSAAARALLRTQLRSQAQQILYDRKRPLARVRRQARDRKREQG